MITLEGTLYRQIVFLDKPEIEVAIIVECFAGEVTFIWEGKATKLEIHTIIANYGGIQFTHLACWLTKSHLTASHKENDDCALKYTQICGKCQET